MSMIGVHRADADPREVKSLWGEIVYRSSLMLAGFFVLLALGNLAYKASEGDPWIPVFPLVIALVIWLSGRSLRYMLNARID